jgi:hypothetical protein
VWATIEGKAWGGVRKRLSLNMGKVKLPAHRAGLPGHASGEQNVSKGSLLHIVPLDPAYKARLAGHVPAKEKIRPQSIQTAS